MDKRDQYGVNAVRRDIASIVDGFVEMRAHLGRIAKRLDDLRWFVGGLAVASVVAAGLAKHFIG
ncbi:MULTISPECIES: hypothetical protein [Paraburkholderia]|jgi:hypothetical protein|uniref:hypothetical protein n=1 Tax=Paraburkholderia TaxID=1822464 RepID=UPI0009410F79|nr:hypothetical protein [Paraburkholderia phenazinium]